MFTWWHRVRDGTLTRRTFQRRMEPVKEEIRRLLRAAVVRAEPKTRGMAKAILKIMLTVTITLKQQERNVLDYLVAAHEARLHGRATPSICHPPPDIRLLRSAKRGVGPIP